MRSLDYMNRVEAYVNRLNSERRTVLETITQVRFLDLMADEEKSCTGGLQQLASFFVHRYVGRSGLPWDFCFFCDNYRRDEGTHYWLFA